MSVLYFLIPVSVLMATAGLAACIWSIRTGQYKHLEEDRWKAVLDSTFENSTKSE